MTIHTNFKSLEREYDEKRDHRRMPMETRVSIQLDGSDETFAGTSKNLSASGLLIETNTLFSKGSKLIIAIDSPNEQFNNYKAKVEVIHVKHCDDNHFLIGTKVMKILS